MNVRLEHGVACNVEIARLFSRLLAGQAPGRRPGGQGRATL